MIISFSNPDLVRTWIYETKCPFPVYVDPARILYTSLGLPRDIKAVMGKSTMRYYGEKSASGEKLPNMGVSEDTQQLGGDFTIEVWLCKSAMNRYHSHGLHFGSLERNVR